MRIFVSHSSDDKELVDVLVTLLLNAFPISGDEIRCTTIPGFGLPTGSNILDTLRDEVRDAPVAVGLLTPSALKSIWVIFELGARWGLEQNIIPICAKGLTPQDLPDPLRSLVAADCSDKQQLQRFLEDVARILELDLARTSTYDRFLSQIAELASVSNNETDASSNSWSPKLVLEWADLDSGKDLTTQVSVISERLQRPKESFEIEPASNSWNNPTDPLKNTNYFQEIFDYTADQAFYKCLSLRIKNLSEHVERRVRLVGRINKTEGLSVRNEMAPMPQMYHELASRFFQSERSEADEASLVLREYGDYWEAIVDYGDLRPHDSRASCPLWFGSTFTQIVLLEGRLLGDDLKKPLECVLEVSMDAQSRLMLQDDVLPYLDLE